MPATKKEIAAKIRETRYLPAGRTIEASEIFAGLAFYHQKVRSFRSIQTWFYASVNGTVVISNTNPDEAAFRLLQWIGRQS